MTTKWVWVVAGSQRHMGGKHGLTEGDKGGVSEV